MDKRLMQSLAPLILSECKGLGLDEDNQGNPVRSVRDEIARIASEVLLFLVKLALAALFLLIDLGIKRLSALVLDTESYSYGILVFVMDVTFVGSAIVISVTGAITIAAEFIVSTYRHLKRLKEE